jgi:signal transduction histidine kinase
VTAALGTIRARRLARSPGLRDLAIACVALAATLALLAGARGASRGPDLPGGILAAAACLPLLAHRRSPLGVLAATTAASAALAGLGYGLGPPFGPTIALFYVATDERTRARIGETALVVLGLFGAHVGATTVAVGGFPTSPILFGIVVWGGAWVLGDQLRQRRRRLADLVERARRAERETERERRLAAAEERTRIARDLHDSAGHAINVILVQAGAARLHQEQDPERTRLAQETIEAVARDTIGEIDQLVGVLREDGFAAAGVEAPPGLGALDTLLARQRAAGLAVALTVEGGRRALPAQVDRAVYRILQEALTNAAKHGRGAAEVELAFGPASLELVVTNAAAPNGSATGGHGLVGMRERAELLGGTLETSIGDGRFRLQARLPYAGERR